MTSPTPPNPQQQQQFHDQRALQFTELKERSYLEGLRFIGIINAGGAVALGGFLQAIWGKPNWAVAAWWILVGMSVLLFGVMIAALTYILRRHVAVNDLPKLNRVLQWLPPAGIVTFVVGMALAVIGGFAALAADAGATAPG